MHIRSDGTAANIFVIAIMNACLLGAPPALAAITLEGVSPASNRNASEIVIPTPAGVVANDVMVASIDARGGGATTITAPSGWTLILRSDTGSTAFDLAKATYYRVAEASEPTSYAWSFAGHTKATGAIIAYAGVDPTAPIDASGGNVHASTSASAGEVTAPSLDTSVPNTQLVAFFGIADNSTFTPPPGMTERFDTNSHASGTDAAGADEAFASTGATGSRTATATGRAVSIGHLIALRPRTDAPTPTPSEIPSRTPAETATSTPTATLTHTPSVAPTDTPTAIPTSTPTATPTAVATSTPTQTAAMWTPTPTPTATSTPGAVAADLCGLAPREACAPGASSSWLLASFGNPARNAMQMKLSAVNGTDPAAFGDPTQATSYSLCAYDSSAGTPSLAVTAHVPAGGTCAGKPCWLAVPHGNGFLYRDRDRSADGVRVFWLRLAANRGTVFLAASGPNVPRPALASPVAPFAQDPNVLVQLVNSDGGCWQAVYPAPATQNALIRARSGEVVGLVFRDRQ